jgi:hypothetical protein
MEDITFIITKLLDNNSFLYTALFNKVSNMFLVNKLAEYDFKIKENLDIFKLYEYFDDPINIDGDIQLINLQNIIITILDPILDPIRNIANLGILDELFDFIRIENIPDNSKIIINNARTASYKTIHQNGGLFKEFKNNIGKLITNIITVLKNNNSNTQQNTKNNNIYNHKPTLDPFIIIGANCGWELYKKNLKNNNTIFSIIDNNNKCPILSSILATITIKGSNYHDEKFNIDTIKLLLKYFNENVYNVVYGKNCALNMEQINYINHNSLHLSSQSSLSSRLRSDSNLSSRLRSDSNSNSSSRLSPNSRSRLSPNSRSRLSPNSSSRLSPNSRSRLSPNSSSRLSPNSRLRSYPKSRLKKILNFITQIFSTKKPNIDSTADNELNQEYKYIENLMTELILENITDQNIEDIEDIEELEELEELEKLEKLDEFVLVNLNNVNAVNNNSEIKSKRIKKISTILSLFGGIGLKHICKDLSKGTLTLENIEKFDTKIGKYLVFNTKLFTKSITQYLKQIIRCKLIFFIINTNIESLTNALNIKYNLIIDNYNNVKKQIQDIKLKLLSITNKKQIIQFENQIQKYKEQQEEYEKHMNYEFQIIYDTIISSEDLQYGKEIDFFQKITDHDATLKYIKDSKIDKIDTTNILKVKNIFYMLEIFKNKLLDWVNNWYSQYETKDFIEIDPDNKIIILIKCALLSYNLLINSPILEDIFEYNIINGIIMCKETYHIYKLCNS